MERKIITKEACIDFTVRALFNFLSECFGIATYMFVGCLGCVVGLGPVGDSMGIVLSFSLAIMLGVEIAYDISGGHLNPILTVASMFFKKVSIPMGIVYIIAQFSGSILGVGLVKALTPGKYYSSQFCCTVPNPNVHIAQAVFIEFASSSILVLFVCSLWNPRNTRLESITIRIGFTVFCLIFATVHFTGGCMNPARSFGPAVWSNTWKHHWIYWLGPFAASFVWSPIYFKLFVELAPQDKVEE